MAISPTGTLSPFKQKLIELVEAEQQFFKGHTETEDKFSDRIGVFWKQGVGLSFTGKDVDQPWSAAFVSWAMKTAGAGENFPYSDHHGHYILAAIENRQTGELDAPIVGFRVSERAPRPGDLIGQPGGGDLRRPGQRRPRDRAGAGWVRCRPLRPAARLVIRGHFPSTVRVRTRSG